MDVTDVLEYVVPLIAVLSLGGMALGAFSIWMKARSARLPGGSPEQLEHITESLEALRQDVQSLRVDLGEQVIELSERVDFAERLLARGPPRPPKDKSNTPA